MARKKLGELNYYELLSLRSDARHDDVKAAFHAFARRYHPDRAASEPDKIGRLNRIYRRGTEAYRVLIDPNQRAIYDRELAGGQLRFDPSQVRATTVPPARGGGQPVGHKARAFAKKARAAEQQGDFKSARLHAKLALGYDPEHPELLALLSSIEAEMGS